MSVIRQEVFFSEFADIKKARIRMQWTKFVFLGRQEQSAELKQAIMHRGDGSGVRFYIVAESDEAP